jgi:hypothetical protein
MERSIVVNGGMIFFHCNRVYFQIFRINNRGSPTGIGPGAMAIVADLEPRSGSDLVAPTFANIPEPRSGSGII